MKKYKGLVLCHLEMDGIMIDAVVEQLLPLKKLSEGYVLLGTDIVLLNTGFLIFLEDVFGLFYIIIKCEINISDFYGSEILSTEQNRYICKK